MAAATNPSVKNASSVRKPGVSKICLMYPAARNERKGNRATHASAAVRSWIARSTRSGRTCAPRKAPSSATLRMADHGNDLASDQAGQRSASPLVKEKTHNTDAMAPEKRSTGARAGIPWSPLLWTNSQPAPIATRPRPHAPTTWVPRARHAIRQRNSVPTARHGERLGVARIEPAVTSIAISSAGESPMYAPDPQKPDATAAIAQHTTRYRRSTGRLAAAAAATTNIQRTCGKGHRDTLAKRQNRSEGQHRDQGKLRGDKGKHQTSSVVGPADRQVTQPGIQAAGEPSDRPSG